MLTAYEETVDRLRREPRRWLVTGVAGFVGSNLLEALLKLDQTVAGIDNFSTGHRGNLDDVRASVLPEQWTRFSFMEGDIRKPEDCRRACDGVDLILHEAAIGSVPRSIADPVFTNENNITGSLNMLVAARDCKVRRLVYAASSSTYGDHPDLPKREDLIGKPLSPYAVTKYVNELYAGVFCRCYGLETIGLRYFNVFGKRQDPNGAYAAVIPRWIVGLLEGNAPTIHGDGETSRDFCYVENVIQANILAAVTDDQCALNQVYNVAVGGRTTLNELFLMIRTALSEREPAIAGVEVKIGPFREGDVRHSQADISKAQKVLGFVPAYDVRRGMAETVAWFAKHTRTSLTKESSLLTSGHNCRN